MEKNKDDIFKAFTAKAVQRLKDKKVTKYETLYVPVSYTHLTLPTICSV